MSNEQNTLHVKILTLVHMLKETQDTCKEIVHFSEALSSLKIDCKDRIDVLSAQKKQYEDLKNQTLMIQGNLEKIRNLKDTLQNKINLLE